MDIPVWSSRSLRRRDKDGGRGREESGAEGGVGTMTLSGFINSSACFRRGSRISARGGRQGIDDLIGMGWG